MRRWCANRIELRGKFVVDATSWCCIIAGHDKGNRGNQDEEDTRNGPAQEKQTWFVSGGTPGQVGCDGHSQGQPEGKEKEERDTECL